MSRARDVNGNKHRIIDTFIFFNELDLLELRFRALYDCVDLFVITECSETFSGKSKPMLFAENRSRFLEFESKIIYNPITQSELNLLRSPEWKHLTTDLNRRLLYKHGGRPAKQLHSSLLREISHRDSGIIALSKIANQDDLILLSDVDEIPNSSVVRALSKDMLDQPVYFKMIWSLYWINNRLNTPWIGTVAFKYKSLAGMSLDMLRFSSGDVANTPGPVVENGGWHFSYLGGSKAIETKLEALPYQGMRAELSKFISLFRLDKWQTVLDQNVDLLMQNRQLQIVPLDASFPSEIYQVPNFVDTYSKALLLIDPAESTK